MLEILVEMVTMTLSYDINAIRSCQGYAGQCQNGSNSHNRQKREY